MMLGYWIGTVGPRRMRFGCVDEHSTKNLSKISELASTHPHHKHIPPDIKHNRARWAPAAPSLSFTQPNLPFLIAEIEQLQS